LSIDPVTTDAGTGNSFNRYNYANNSPYRYIDLDGREACPGQSANRCIMSGNFNLNQTKSNEQTTVASPAVAKAMVQNKAAVAVTDPGASGGKMGFVVQTKSGLTVQVATGAKTSSTSSLEKASAEVPQGAVAVTHGHIDGIMNVVSSADAAPLK
jgi:hypothetical protein